MKRLFLGCSLVWLCAGTRPLSDAVVSQAQTTATGAAVLGPGWADCDEVTDQVSSDDNLRFLFTAWIQGYITGKNEAGTLKDVGADAAPSALLAAALRYCEENPMNKFSDAARDIYDQLAQRSQGAR